jgi:hypothetical protein
MLGTLTTWFLADAVGPHLVGKLIDHSQRPPDWDAQVADGLSDIAPAGALAGRRQAILAWLNDDDVWEKLIRPSPAGFEVLTVGLASLLEITREDSAPLVDTIVAGFLQSLDPSLAVAVADYRRATDAAQLAETLFILQERVAFLVEQLARAAVSVDIAIVGNRNIVTVNSNGLARAEDHLRSLLGPISWQMDLFIEKRPCKFRCAWYCES